MELRHLRYFIAVAEEGHVTRAAERLGIQQPPLSRMIKRIEKQLDVQLFRRKPRGVELTDAGQVFLDRARAILSGFDQAFETTRRTARGDQGAIRVGMPPTVAFHPFVPHVIRDFRDAFPLVAITLDEARSDELIESLRNERIDVAFVRSSLAKDMGLTMHPLFEEEMVVALPRAHALARSDFATAVPLKALASENFIIQRRETGLKMYAETIAACHAAGFSPSVRQEVPRITFTLTFVAAGLGISLVPASLQRLQMDGVVYRRLKGHVHPKAPLNLASRRGDPSPVVRRFLNLAKRSARMPD